MIQFNLLPDIKVQYIKTQRLKRMMTTVSVVAIAASVGLLILMFSFVAVQNKHVENLDKDIDALTSELQGNPELTKILSVQNQLNSLPQLYAGRPAIDRLPGYIDQATPVGVNMGRLIVDFSTSTIEVTGQASSLELMNAYVDSLKYTTFEKTAEDGSKQSALAFGNVVLTTVGRNAEGAEFTLIFNFDPYIFDINKQVALTVPSLVTTRAQAPNTDLLFNGAVPAVPAEGTQ